MPVQSTDAFRQATELVGTDNGVARLSAARGRP